MTKFFLQSALISLIILPSLCNGQGRECLFTMSPEINTEKRYAIMDFFELNATTYLVELEKSNGENNYSISELNNDLKKLRTVSIDLKNQTGDRTYQFILQSNGKVMLFSSYYDRKNSKIELYSQELNRETLVPNSTLTEVLSLGICCDLYQEKIEFNLKFSNDSSKIMIFATQSNEEFGFKNYAAAILNHNLKVLWNINQNLNTANKFYKICDYDISNTGQLYLLEKEYYDKFAEMNSDKPNYSFKMKTYSEGSLIEENGIDYDSKFIGVMKFAVIDSIIMFAGYYSDTKPFYVKGLYYTTTNKAFNVVKKGSIPFDLQFILEELTEAELETTRKKKLENSQEMYKFDVKNVFVGSDMDILIIGEQKYIESHFVLNETPSDRNVNAEQSLTCGNIIVTKISESGDKSWNTKIYKNQTDGIYGHFSSHLNFFNNDKLYFVYNDDPANFESKNINHNALFNPINKTDLVLTSVDKNGAVNKCLLRRTDDFGLVLSPVFARNIRNEKIFLWGSQFKLGKKEKGFGSLELTD